VFATSRDDSVRWERHSDIVFGVLPYFLLLLSTALSLAHSKAAWDPGERPITLALVGAAAAWILGTFTLPARGKGRGRYAQLPTALYFAGLLGISAVLLTRDQVFVLFAATGFLQALVLLPTLWALVCVAAASFLVNTVPNGFPEPTAAAVTRYLGGIALQTAVIGWVNLLSRRLTEQHEQRKRTVAELQEALAENAGLHAQLVAQAREAGVHDERQRMAGEIHDTLAQGLAGIIRQLEAADHADGDDQCRLRHLDAARELARQSLSEARRSVQALRPGQLETSPLPDAIAELAGQWSAEHAIKAEFFLTGRAAPMHPKIEATLYRVAQEALANIAKHAGAARTGITLSYMEDVVLLDVVDDGDGFAPPAVGTEAATADGSGLGLVAMRRRLHRVAGTLEIESTPGEGTAIGAGVPFIPPPEAGA